MNHREALLTGLVLGVLRQVVADPESPFTYVEVEAVGGDFTNRVQVTASDGTVLLVTVDTVEETAVERAERLEDLQHRLIMQSVRDGLSSLQE